MTDHIKVEGLTRLRLTMAQAARAVADMRQANVGASNLLRTRGRSDAPRRSGGLAMAVTSQVEQARGTSYVVVSNAKPYAKRVHWGYRRYGQAPQPWLGDVGVRNRSTVTRMYLDNTKDAVRKVKGA